jgi:hypothetical protein
MNPSGFGGFAPAGAVFSVVAGGRAGVCAVMALEATVTIAVMMSNL